MRKDIHLYEKMREWIIYLFLVNSAKSFFCVWHAEEREGEGQKGTLLNLTVYLFNNIYASTQMKN
jgi:hypothetical protein